jgi:hypothetical protein
MGWPARFLGPAKRATTGGVVPASMKNSVFGATRRRIGSMRKLTVGSSV